MTRHSVDLLETMATKQAWYEVQMMALTARRQTPACDNALCFAVLESYVLHCRNLAEFLTGTSPRATVVVVQDGFDDP